MIDPLIDAIVRKGLDRYTLLTDEKNRIAKEASTLLAATQSACDHPPELVVEAVHHKYNWAKRICVRCGYTECGNFFDYYLLESREGINPATISWEDGEARQLGPSVQEDELKNLKSARWDSRRTESVEAATKRIFDEALGDRK